MRWSRRCSDLRAADVNIVTIGQYLRPSLANLPMVRYYTPEEFAELKRIGLELGFGHVESGPLVRSSYHAHEADGGLLRVRARKPTASDGVTSQRTQRRDSQRVSCPSSLTLPTSNSQSQSARSCGAGRSFGSCGSWRVDWESWRWTMRR